MSKSQKEECQRKLSASLEYVGANFPEDDFDDPSSSSSSSSGRDSSDSDSHRKCRKKKVKSGSKIKKRPVVKTELWPHTIINENEGEDVSCDNITLAKFFTGFTYIMSTVKKGESKGRSALLHAICMILDVLPWSEARTFHNLSMIKIE